MLWMRAAGWGLALLICTSIEAAAADPKRVLLLHSFGRDFAPFSDAAESFRTELIKSSPTPIDFYEASIFTARFRQPDQGGFHFGFPKSDQGPFLSGFQGPDQEAALVEYLRDLFSKRSLRLVVTLGTPATRLVQQHRPRLFPDTPLLIMGSAERRLLGTSMTANDAVVVQKIDVRAYVDNILRLLPDTREIVFVIGDSLLERYWASQARPEIQRFADRVKFTWFNELSLDEMLRRAAALPAQSVIFYAMVAVDGAGTPHPLDRAFERIRGAAKVPIFGYGDHLLGRGIVGGPVTPVVEHGREAAQVALRILNGERPGNIKARFMGPGTPVYDWRELQRWGISEALLPSGSIVRFRQPTAWERYRWQILVIMAALLVQALLIAGLLYQRHRRNLAEVEVRRRMTEIAHMNRSAAVGEMSASIAHEINQPLAAIVSSGNAGLRWLTNKSPDLEEVAAALKRIVSDGHRASQVIESIRAMFKKDAQQRILVDVNDLLRDVLALLSVELAEGNVSVRTVLTEGLPRVLADQVQLQQVVLNIVRNAIEAMGSVADRPRELRVRSEADESGKVMVTIADTGPGFTAEDADRVFEPFYTTKPKGMGMGLSICRSIIESHGGQLSAAPGRPHGAVFQIVLPAPPDEG